MIEVNTICTCDRCKKVIPEMATLFKIKKEKVNMSYYKKEATDYSLQICGDGIPFTQWSDQYKAYHVCSDCSEDLVNFLENAE